MFPLKQVQEGRELQKRLYPSAVEKLEETELDLNVQLENKIIKEKQERELQRELKRCFPELEEPDEPEDEQE